MKKNYLIAAFCAVLYVLASCDLFSPRETTEQEPPYTARIAWDSGVMSNDNEVHTLDGDYVYIYERPVKTPYNNIYTLTKLDAQTGEVIWRSKTFSDIQFCQPVIIEGHVYVFLEPNVICSFDKETGELSAFVRADIDNQNLEMVWNSIGYGRHLYFGLHGMRKGSYLVRLDVNNIDRSIDPDTVQTINAEIMWRPVDIGLVWAKPVVSDNIIYTATSAGYCPVEIAGINIDTREVVFYQTLGMYDDGTVYDEGGMDNPIFIHEGVLYHLSYSITAYSLVTGKQLYQHIFTDGITFQEQYYGADSSLQPVFYRGKLYYTSGSSGSSGYRNVHCIDAATGKLVWNAVAKGSESFETNPILAYGKVYIPQSTGLRVYDAESGRLIGVDKNFAGVGLYGRNLLYKDYLICTRYDRDNYGTKGSVVAVYVGE